jgi:hypothetical protein
VADDLWSATRLGTGWYTPSSLGVGVDTVAIPLPVGVAAFKCVTVAIPGHATTMALHGRITAALIACLLRGHGARVREYLSWVDWAGQSQPYSIDIYTIQ